MTAEQTRNRQYKGPNKREHTMKAVYAVLSMMLAASLAWAGSGGEVGIFDRCEVQERCQGIRPERVSQYDDMRYDNELEHYQGQNPGSERDDMRSDVELGIAPSRNRYLTPSSNSRMRIILSYSPRRNSLS